MSAPTPSSAGDAGIGYGLDLLTGYADDQLETAVRSVMDGAEQFDTVPVIGQAISGLQSGYHLGSAAYDAVTGDRDGAVAHGTQALVNAAMVVPGVNEVFEGADAALGWTGTGTRIGSEILGADQSYVDAVPTGLDDVAASAAVGLTNAVFGEQDQTNNTGTRGGEISAGMMGMNAMATGMNPLALAAHGASWAMGADPGTQIANLFGVANEPTSGVEPSKAAQAGQWFHDLF